MARIVTKPTHSAGKDALENFDTLANYAVSGARKAKRRVKDNGSVITIIKEGNVVEVHPNGTERVVQDVANVGRFEPLVASE